MKNLLFLTSTLFTILFCQAQQPFTFTWDAFPQYPDVLIPTNSESYAYNYTVDFGDGTILTNQTGDITHTYSNPGNYTISITGEFPHFYGPDLQPNNLWARFKSIEQWGDIQWKDMSNTFVNCEFLVINATDAPDLSQCTDMSSMFKETIQFNQSINHWDVSNITNMSEMFVDSQFNNDLSNWDTSNVENMSKMFYRSIYNQPLNNWDVSSVSNFSGMFEESIFNQPLNNWNLTGATDMSYMFSKSIYNLPLGSWDVSSVINMSNMFFEHDTFNQNINNWNVSSVIDFSGMFSSATIFNQPLDSWDISNANTLAGMFGEAISFNQNINTWDVSNVIDFIFMFKDAENFNQPLDNWNMANAEFIGSMFDGATSFNQPLNVWNVSNVVNMYGTFSNTAAFNQPLNNWDVSNVNSTSSMFFNAMSFDQPLDNWIMSSVTTINSMFRGAVSFNQNINSWDVSNILDMQYVFSGATLFDQPLENWDVTNVNFFRGMFNNASSFNQNIDNWNTTNVSDMNEMFENAISYNQPLNNWDVSNVNNMSNMFKNAVQFNQPLDNWDVSNLNCSFTFGGGCEDIFNGALSFNQDLSNWNFLTYSLVSSGFTFEVLNLEGILSNSGMDTANYDLFLNKLSQINLDSGYMVANNIEYCDEFVRQFLVDNDWNIDDGGVSDDCEYNYISGNVFYDYNIDGCDPGDIVPSNHLINISNGSFSLGVDIQSNGEYQIGVNAGNYNLEILNIDSNFTINPVMHTVILTDQNENIEDMDFCITASQQIDDISIDILPLGSIIPGFETDYQIIVSNNGTQTIPNANVTFIYQDNLQDFLTSSIIPSGSSTNLLTFDIFDIDPLSFEIIEITMLNEVPPILISGDGVIFTSQVTSSINDINPSNNSVIRIEPVFNSFDPNDKMVVQGDEIDINDTNQYLDYRIRFQNLGTANALNVKITDTIHPNLDWTTFQPITSSHDYRIEIVNGEQINYYFDNINLPFETADPEGSNGYITYKIKPKPSVQIGDTFENTAYIYFDFNLPVITNTVVTTVVDNLDVNTFDFSGIDIYPNPVKDKLNISLPNNLQLHSIELFDIQGKRIKLFENQFELDFSAIQQGIYILRLDTNQGVYNHKVVKA